MAIANANYYNTIGQTTMQTSDVHDILILNELIEAAPGKTELIAALLDWRKGGPDITVGKPVAKAPTKPEPVVVPEEPEFDVRTAAKAKRPAKVQKAPTTPDPSTESDDSDEPDF